MLSCEIIENDVKSAGKQSPLSILDEPCDISIKSLWKDQLRIFHVLWRSK